MRYNNLTLAGRLTKDPDSKTTPNGTSVCQLRIAFDQGSGDNKKTGYVDVSCFQKVAENAAKYLKKGSGVLIGGRLEYQEWQDQNGNNRNAVKVIAHDLQFTDTKKQDGGNQQGGPGTDGW